MTTQLAIYYYPKVNAQSGELVGTDVWHCWNHSEKGVVYPREFIRITEGTGMNAPIADWVLHEACRQYSHWRNQGHPSMSISVNISLSQLLQPDIVTKIGIMLKDTGINPRHLILVISESTMIHYAQQVIGTLKALKKFGIRLAMDDFAVGDDNLQRMTVFPIDQIKVDSSNDPYELEAVVKLAHNLNISVAAKGVEKAEQWSAIKALDFDEAQGSLFSEPKTRLEFERHILKKLMHQLKSS